MIDRKKLMLNLWLRETEDGFRDALDFLIEQINTGGLKAPMKAKEAWRNSLTHWVKRVMEKDNLTFSRACAIVDVEQGKKDATAKQTATCVPAGMGLKLLLLFSDAIKVMIYDSCVCAISRRF